MFTEIKGKEILIMAKALSTNHYNEKGELVKGLSMEETLTDMELIDDLLVIMKSKSLLNRKRGLKRLLSMRIEMETKNSSIVPGTSNIQLRDV